MAKKKIDHKRFRELGGRISEALKAGKAATLSRDEALIVQEHWEWFEAYINAQAKRSGKGGRPQLPDDEVQPESLRRRELRKKT